MTQELRRKGNLPLLPSAVSPGKQTGELPWGSGAGEALPGAVAFPLLPLPPPGLFLGVKFFPKV